MDLHSVVIKDANFHPEMMKKDGFQSHWYFFRKYVYLKSPILQLSEDLLFFLICYRDIKKTTCQLKCYEKIHLRKFYG